MLLKSHRLTLILQSHPIQAGVYVQVTGHQGTWLVVSAAAGAIFGGFGSVIIQRLGSGASRDVDASELYPA